MITRPLDLESKLSAPPRDLDVLFWVNAGVVLLFFSILGSRFVLAPGLSMQVGSELVLPGSHTASQGAASIVVSYRRDNMVLFEGGIYELRDLRPRLEQYAKEHPGSVMLVRYDKAVSMQGFVDLCDLAQAAGFAHVQLATEPQPAEESGLFTPLR
jgi:biopolymer transport protein ExbD